MTNPNGSQPDASTAPKYYGRLHERLAKGEFACTIEIAPPRGASLGAFRRAARSFRDWADAANVTDNQSAYARMAGWAGCVALQQEGVEPVMQLQCRDRNRIALQAELLGAAGVGIPNLLLLTGDHQRFGDHQDAKGVFDMDSIQLVWTARTMRNEQKLLSGSKLSVAPKWLIGAVENPFAAPQEWRAERLGKKIAAGAQFVQTQLVYDLPLFAKWMARVRDLGFDKRCWILPTICPIRSVRALEYMQKELSGIWIPDEVGRRLRGVEAADVEEEGIRVAVETVQALREMPGVAGIHISMPGQEEHFSRILVESGARTAPVTSREPLTAPLATAGR
jgi:methylenetetrahydrofolate reductase (NADPH)